MRALRLAVLTVAMAACAETAVGPTMDLNTRRDPVVSLSEYELDGTTFTRLSGGGFLKEGDNHISFAGNVETASGLETMEWVVQFHSVPDLDVSGATFHATELIQTTFFDNDSPTCIAAMNMTIAGELDGEPGYRMIFRVGDSGKIKLDDVEDTARVELYLGTNKIYDTHGAGSGFSSVSSCVGTARAALGGGNLKLR